MIGTVVADIWFDPDLRVAANITLIYVAALTTVFTGLYLLRSKWWANRIGKTYLVKNLVMSLVLLQIVLARGGPRITRFGSRSGSSSTAWVRSCISRCWCHCGGNKPQIASARMTLRTRNRSSPIRRRCPRLRAGASHRGGAKFPRAQGLAA